MFFKFINKYQNEILRCAPPSHLWVFLIWLKGELELVYKSYVGENSYCYSCYCLLYLIWAGNNEPFRVTPSTSSGQYRYSVSGGPALTTGSVGFFRFLIFCVPQFLYASVSLWVCGSVCNPSQVFKNLLLSGS